jgi:hypothetical protein
MTDFSDRQYSLRGMSQTALIHGVFPMIGEAEDLQEEGQRKPQAFDWTANGAGSLVETLVIFADALWL